MSVSDELAILRAAAASMILTYQSLHSSLQSQTLMSDAIVAVVTVECVDCVVWTVECVDCGVAVMTDRPDL